MTDVLLVADTHLGATAADRLTERIAPELAIADVIVHAGDITELGVLDALAAHAVVHAVKGNNDHGLDLPERELVTVDGCTFAVVHDSGPSVSRAARLRRWFPDADVVVFGHSHLPWHETHVARRRTCPAPREPGFGDVASAGTDVHRGPCRRRRR